MTRMGPIAGGCVDAADSGVLGLACAKAKSYCDDPIVKAQLAKYCPRTCGRCGGGAASDSGTGGSGSRSGSGNGSGSGNSNSKSSSSGIGAHFSLAIGVLVGQRHRD